MPLIPMLAIAALGAAASSAQVPEFRHCVFGEAYAFTNVRCTAYIANSSDRPLRLVISPTWGGDSVEQSHVTVPAHGESAIPLNLAVGNRAGKLKRYFSVSPEVGREEGSVKYLEATGFVMTALDAPRPSIDFGSVATNSSESIKKTLTLGSHDGASFRINRVLEKPNQIDVDIAPDRKTVVVRVRGDATWGVLDGDIKLAIDTPYQKQAWVGVHGELHGDVSPQANPVSLGILPAQKELLLQLTELHAASGKKLVTGIPRVDGLKAEAEIVDCEPKTKICRALRLKVLDTQQAGMVRGKVFVPLPDFHRDIAIDLEGFFQADQSAINPGGAPEDGAQSRLVELPSLLPEESQNNASAEPAEKSTIGELPPPPGTGPLLKWSTLDERVVYGYQVFRSNSEDGPFILLNVPAIPAKSSSKAGSRYQWRDNSAVKGKTYWYYVGVVYNDARKEKITPEMKATAK